jgi:hypothetical protein
MRRFILLIMSTCVVFSLLQREAAAQFTSPTGNFEVYARKVSASYFGFLNTTIVLPSNQGIPAYELTQKGILYSRQYSLGAFDPIVISMNDQIAFAFDGFFRIGGAVGSGNTGEPWGPFTSSTAKYYVGLLDVFAMDITPSYTHMFRNGTGLTAKVGFTILNLGATVAILEKGVFRESGILVANILPVQISATLLFDFGRSALGFSVLVNASSILNYTETPEDLYNDEYRGLLSNTVLKRVAFQIVYSN